MPIYEYVCQSCQGRFEALVFGGRTPDCPACGGHDLEKQVSAFAVGGQGATTRRAPAPAVGGG